jgi:glyoxylase-like metal-dependent hydrolase (beta-lactamase superfamily II)
MGATHLVCHCLLVEAPGGLVLIDTGIGKHDIASPRRRLGAGFLALSNPRLDDGETALRRIEQLGFQARDVRDVIVTHLDPDHAGGLSDFPEARVHVHALELEATRRPRGLFERVRYRAAHFDHRPRWQPHTPDGAQGGDRWLGFQSVRALDATADILLVPLTGHSRGHSGVAVRNGDGWLLHCGDAFFHRGELEEPPSCPPFLVAMQRIDDSDHEARVANQARLRALKREHGASVIPFCSHDPAQLEPR